MHSEIKDIIGTFLSNSSDIKRLDLLVNIDDKQTIPFQNSFSLNSFFDEIFKKGKKIEKESGINPLCKSIGIIQIENNKGKPLKCPVFLQEVQVSKFNNNFNIIEVGELFLNPYLYQLLNIHPSEEIISFEQLINLNLSNDYTWNENVSFLGNFHPFRFEIIRDLAELKQKNIISKCLAQLLLIDQDKHDEKIEFNPNQLFPSDFSQNETLKILKNESVVVHGPPGTGKSQLISNTIGSAINNDLSILMSSEKKSSLDAVYKRLKSRGLHRFCLVNYSKNENNLLIRDLKKTWDFLNKENLSNDILFENHFSYSSVIQKFISSPKIEAMSLYKLAKKIQNSRKINAEITLNQSELKESETQIYRLNQKLFNLTNYLNLNQSWSDQVLTEVISKCKKIVYSVEPYFPVRTCKDVDQLVRNLLIIEGFSSKIYLKHGKIIAEQSKKINRLFTEYLKIERNSLKWEERSNHWIKKPSVQEVQLILKNASKKGFIDRLKFKTEWKKWVRSPQLNPILTCNEMLDFTKFQDEKNRFTISLKELGIESQQELLLIHEVAKNHSKENWSWYSELDQHLIENFKSIHSNISELKRLINDHFNLKDSVHLLDVFDEIILKKQEILNELAIFQQLPVSVRNIVSNCESISELTCQLYWSVWKTHYSDLEVPSSSIMNEWLKSSLRFEKNKQLEQKTNATNIIQNFRNKFISFHSLMETPNRKLSKEEQDLKNELKIGKKILIKEFGKTKQHLGLRKLYESDAKKWLQLLKPILMMHPLRIATYFPPEANLFDLGIIDEASQMPFRNSIGTLQRVKRMLIAGDENQMDPSFFFSTNDNDHSVFHQAKYHLKNIELAHHYRSESEELISFSNRYFYDNRLRFIEKANFENKHRVSHHFIQNGNYHNGMNENEAQECANYLIKRLETNSNDESIGVVSFSESQLKTILKKIPQKYSNKINELEEENRLFFKTLDQVQGDECDILIISFGYGRNKEGSFEMRFGPINQLGGEKRLNVLFSRAKKEIHFFSSVKYSDFPQTKNDAVLLLKEWFAMLENNSAKITTKYEIHILDILEIAKDVDDFTHLVSIYNDRGWKILTT